MPLRWRTMELPGVDGWYWYRPALDREASVKEIRNGYVLTGYLPRPISHLSGGEWAGPIPEPVEGE
jgi:ABC-type cobalamin transport system ATPase subunit